MSWYLFVFMLELAFCLFVITVRRFVKEEAEVYRNVMEALKRWKEACK
jgi:hypothetical protein